MPRKSHLEERFSKLLTFKRLTPFEEQYRFHPVRRWRFDFAILPCFLAIEIQGGTYLRHRTGHTTAKGHQNDVDKHNAAIELGWTMLYFTTKDLKGKKALESVNLVQKIAIELGVKQGL